jgi:hypothetical protein
MLLVNRGVCSMATTIVAVVFVVGFAFMGCRPCFGFCWSSP